jgi:hypothetical protein
MAPDSLSIPTRSTRVSRSALPGMDPRLARSQGIISKVGVEQLLEVGSSNDPSGSGRLSSM